MTGINPTVVDDAQKLGERFERPFDLQFIADKELSAYDSKTVQIDAKADTIGVARRGPLSRLRVYLGLPSATLVDFNMWAINTLVLNVAKRLKIGNK